MDLVSFVTGVGPTAVFTPGVNTPNVNGATHTGVTDGTGPSTASNNMAEIYNRLLLQVASIIVKSGLTVDNTNWAQAGVAVQKIVNDAITMAGSGYLTPAAAAAVYETIAHATSTYATQATVNSRLPLSTGTVFVSALPGTGGVTLPAVGTWAGIWNASSMGGYITDAASFGGATSATPIAVGYNNVQLFAVRTA